MARKTLKAAALAVTLGTVFLFGGCLSGATVQRAFWAAAGYTGLQYLLDNPDVTNLFDQSPGGMAG